LEGYLESAHIVLFLFGAFVISLSGALMPGPLTAAAIAKGQKSRNAGVLVALGHGAIEIPLIILIALGLSNFFREPLWKIFIGVVGGIVLTWMGVGMIRDRAALSEGRKPFPFGSMRAGLITTVSNPYFFIWWATIGAVLITKSLTWGVIGITLFAVVHWSSDLFWIWMLSQMSHRGKKVMSPGVQSTIFAVCGIILVAFGLYFLIDGSGIIRFIGEKTVQAETVSTTSALWSR